MRPKKVAPKEPRVKYMELYKYSSAWDKFVVYSGLMSSVFNGAIQPAYALVIGKVAELFNPNLKDDEKSEIFRDFVIILSIGCVGNYLFAYLSYALMQISGERISFKLRALYLASLMKQEVSFFEG